MSIEASHAGEFALQHVAIDPLRSANQFQVDAASVVKFDIVQISRGQDNFNQIDFIFCEPGRQFELQEIFTANKLLDATHYREFLAAQLLANCVSYDQVRHFVSPVSVGYVTSIQGIASNTTPFASFI
jgi:hypothetical protein